jgi:hypothetical protein
MPPKTQDPRFRTRRCPDIPIHDPTCFWDPINLRTGENGGRPGGFVCRGSSTIQQSCLGSKHGARANGHKVFDFRVHAPDEVNCAVHGTERRDTTRDDEHFKILGRSVKGMRRHNALENERVVLVEGRVIRPIADRITRLCYGVQVGMEPACEIVNHLSGAKNIDGFEAMVQYDAK